MLSGNDVLHLKNSSIPTSLPASYRNETLRLFPNPTEDYSTLEFETTQPGTADLAIYNVTGMKLAQLREPLPPGSHTFQVSPPGTGLYMIRINADGKTFSGKLVSHNTHEPDARLIYLNSADNRETERTLKTAESSWYMEYKPGEKLLLTVTSGIYTTTVSAVPTHDETILVNFYDCIDVENNIYPTVEIGSQVWMGANLKTTRFNNGKIIPQETGSGDWLAEDSASYCWQRNDRETYRDTYGAMYNGYAAMNENLCPEDWHVPSVAEFKILEQTLGSRAVAGGRLKESGLLHWEDPNSGATNSSGFTMLPGGYRSGEDGSGFYDLGRYGYLWSLTATVNEESATYWGFSKDEEKTEQGVSGLHTGFSVRCIRNDSVPRRMAPQLSTDSVTRLGLDSARAHYTITSDGGRDITVTGICWGLTKNPDTAQCKTIPVTGIGHYTLSLDSLKENTLYYARAFAINAKGIGYGNSLAFRTPENTKGTVTDIEGNQYRSVKIGRQVWMAENLRTETYNDSKPIVLRTNYYVWTRMTSGAYCWYENNEGFKATYGALYNWYSAATGKLCPSGWHVPDIEEWQELSNYLGGKSVAGGKMKETGSSHWNSQGGGVTNSSGFTALGGGWRNGIYDSVSAPHNGGIWMHEKAAWLSMTIITGDELSPTLNSGSNELITRQTQKSEGNSVRCLKNDTIVEIVPPTIKTDMPAFIPRTWATVTATIIDCGGSTNRMQGFCRSVHPDPDTSDFTMMDTSRLNKFTMDVPVPLPETTYYIRAFGINDGGVGYGNTLILTTLPEVEYGTVSDWDGNSYKTVQIGKQTWMAENLKTKTLNDGTPISLLTEIYNLEEKTLPYYCWYENNIGNKTLYGALYNWPAVATDKLCPTGWHVPSQYEWEILRDTLGGEEVAGGKLKEAGTSHWHPLIAGATNSTGFNALPGGVYGYNFPWHDFYGFCLMHKFATFLTSTVMDDYFIQRVTMEADNNSLIIEGFGDFELKQEGGSVRCLKNDPPSDP